MVFKYEVTTPEGKRQSGTIEAATIDIAISSLQSRNFIVLSIDPSDEKKSFFKGGSITFFEHVKTRDIVIFSRQISTLFEAKVPVIDSFKLLAAESKNPMLRRTIKEVVQDVQGGLSMSEAMKKHPKVFSDFYVAMVRSGEESGKLDEIFSYLAEYLERAYELSSKAKNALIYPAFVVFTFFAVMILMMTVVIPRLGSILRDTGNNLPFYTRVVLSISESFVQYGLIFLAVMIVGAIALWRYLRTESGKDAVARLQVSAPYVGVLYQKFFLARITDNLNTLMASGIPVVRALEISTEVVGNRVYENILKEAVKSVKGGSSISEEFTKHKEVPPLISQMMKIGEQSGRLGHILNNLSKFYKREVDSAVDTLVSLIEPVMIVFLGLAVGILLVSVLGPIYNISANV